MFDSVGALFSAHVSTPRGDENQTLPPKGNGTEMHAKILLVEDDAVVRWMVENALKGECEVNSVDAASRVFSLYPSYNPHIVLLDIGLPDNSGNAVLEWIIRNDPSACVIMLSGRSNIDDISACLEAGAKGFIPKPFVKESLLHYIRKHA